MRRFLLGPAVLLVALSAASAQVTISSTAQPTYRNRAYAYQVKLPPGVSYTRTSAPNPDHGFSVPLKEGAVLWVDATYTDFSSTGEEANSQSAGCEVHDRRQSRLGDREAVRIRFSCPANAYGPAYEEVLVVSLLRIGDRALTSYKVAMRGKVLDSSDDMKLFDAIVAGFTFQS